MKKNYHFAGIIFTINILMALFLFSPENVTAQINAGGQPMSSLVQLNSELTTVTMPEIDTDQLLAEDKITEAAMDMPFRFGYNFDVNYDLQNSGVWEVLSDGSRVWRLAIRSADAVSINLAYKNFVIPQGATFFVYNLDKSYIYGAFTELNNTEDKQFATSPTYGSTTVLEYYEPVYANGKGSITISKVTHAYKDIFGYNSVLEEPCNININCPIGAGWVEQKRSVTRITFSEGSGSFLCSGALMNNTLQNRAPLYLFADHCSTDNFSTITFYFNYENPTCVGTLGSLASTMVGATLKARNVMTDFQLVQLNQSVPANFNAHFNGWDKSGSNPLNQTAIHHPGGAVKKISHDDNPAVTASWPNGGNLPNGFWRVVWDQGMTEGGSSGCPLYDQNHRVIGQNLGGTTANCSNPQSVTKYFGKLSESWAFGGASNNQLKDWLDPNNSGVSTLDGIDAVTGVAPVTNFTSNVQVLPMGGGNVDFFDLTTNNPTTWSWSFPGGTPSTSDVRNPSGIVYTATGNYTVSLTTTNAFGSNLKTFVSYIKVQGVQLNTFVLQTPTTGSRVVVSQTDPSIFQFKWGTANPSPTVKYNFKIKRTGPGTEYFYPSDNNGLDSVKSLRKSFLDSLASTLGINGGDSAVCAWRVTALNGADSISTNSFLITIRRETVGINQISSVIPEQFNLYNNYPNPFNPNTIIKFDVRQTQMVSLKIYNTLGEEVRTLVNQVMSPGAYSVDFSAGSIASGIYFYRLETDGFAQTKRMMLVK